MKATVELLVKHAFSGGEAGIETWVQTTAQHVKNQTTETLSKL